VKVLAIRLSSKKTPDRKKNLIAYFTPDATVTEQYRSIKANIHFTCSNLNIRTLLITSPNDGDGKSMTASNLAVSMAQQSERVLLIDANLRSPTSHHIFKISNDTGVTSILNGMTTLEDTIHKTEIGRLDVLPSGPSTFFPSELLASESFTELLVNSQRIYDYVLIDSPSVLEVADTKILANQCEGVVLVLNPRKTKLEKVREVKKVLEFTNTQIAGVIFNNK
jgi:capsular exopolysaccharide synthesis family protein